MSATKDPIATAPELCKLNSMALSKFYSDGQLSPVEVVEAALSRAESVQNDLNAFSFIDHKGAMASARASESRWHRGTPLSPIDGVPTTIKDIVWVQDWVVRFGSQTTSQRPLNHDAPSVAHLRAAGATFIGQTTSPEFAWKTVTDSPLRGVTRNPWDSSKTSGGSSGGAAVAAATGAGVFHLGTDAGGSIRIPAAFCGIVGLKPTFGRVPNSPPSGFYSLSHTGPMTRSVADASRMLTAMSGRNVKDWTQSGDLPSAELSDVDQSALKVGAWFEPADRFLDPEVRRAVSEAIQKLSLRGASIRNFKLPIDDVAEIFDYHWLAGAALRYSAIAEEDREKMDPGLREAAEKGTRFSAVELLAAQVMRASFGATMDAALQEVDVILSPATAHLPFDVQRNSPPASRSDNWTEWCGYSYPFNLTGQPACVVPCGFSEGGLPIGLQIIGARGADGLVLSVAKVIQDILG